MTYDRIDLESIADGYVEAALWADCMPACTCPPETCPCESGGFNGRLEPTPESRAYVLALVTAFAEAAGDALVVFADLRAFRPEDGDVWSHIGHDMRLSSGGHGTGFWDRDPEPTNFADDGDRERFAAAREALHALAYDDRRFTRIGGGDVWQRDDDTAEFDPIPFHEDAAPGDRWECPPLTSAQRQAWIETGRVPDVADTYPAG